MTPKKAKASKNPPNQGSIRPPPPKGAGGAAAQTPANVKKDSDQKK